MFAPGVRENYADIATEKQIGDYTGVTGDDLKETGNGTSNHSNSCRITAIAMKDTVVVKQQQMH